VRGNDLLSRGKGAGNGGIGPDSFPPDVVAAVFSCLWDVDLAVVFEDHESLIERSEGNVGESRAVTKEELALRIGFEKPVVHLLDASQELLGELRVLGAVLQPSVCLRVCFGTRPRERSLGGFT